MKLGIDIDGVLADFMGGFSALTEQEFGIKLPQPWQTYDWHKDNGVTPEQTNYLWELIKSGPFYGTLMPLPGALDAIERLNKLSLKDHDIYFITSRNGTLTKFWTEMWLKFHGMDMPTVLLTKDKGAAAKALGLDVFVDDKPENNLDVIDATGRHCVSPSGSLGTNIHVYLINTPYNQWADQPFNYGVRVTDLNEVLEREFLTTKVRAA
jgi:uncharacterized HAD superfamily protein